MNIADMDHGARIKSKRPSGMIAIHSFRMETIKLTPFIAFQTRISSNKGLYKKSAMEEKLIFHCVSLAIDFYFDIRLPSWQPILTAGTVLPTFFIIGIAFIPVGIILLYFSNSVSHFSRKWHMRDVYLAFTYLSF
jgi:hypothetical protein